MSGNRYQSLASLPHGRHKGRLRVEFQETARDLLSNGPAFAHLCTAEIPLPNDGPRVREMLKLISVKEGDTVRTAVPRAGTVEIAAWPRLTHPTRLNR